MKGGYTLNKNTEIVWKYLQKYFASNSKAICPLDVHIDGLTVNDINIAFSELNNTGKIVLNNKYVHPYVESISE